MANTDKNLVITPGIGSSTDDPKIVFSAANANVTAQTITVRAYPDNSGTISFEGSAGQLFSITNSLSGTLFSVNDISGIPSIEVDDAGTITFARFSGNVLAGSATSISTDKLQITGNLAVTTAGSVKMFNTANTYFTAIKANATAAANVTYTLPSADGINGQVLSTNGSGVLSWSAGGVGYTGSIGYTGSASTQIGYTGSQGPAGGYTGSQGYTGSVGSSALYQATYTPPTTSTLSVQRTGAGTISDISGGRGIRMSAPGTSTNTNNLIYAMKTVSAGATGWNAILKMQRHIPMAKWGNSGILLRDSSGGKSESLSLSIDTVTGLNYYTYTNDTTWNAVTGLNTWYELDIWIKVEEVSGTRNWYISKDGDIWQQIYTQGVIASAWVPSVTHVGCMYNPNYGDASSASNRSTGYVDFLSWSQNAL